MCNTFSVAAYNKLKTGLIYPYIRKVWGEKIDALRPWNIKPLQRYLTMTARADHPCEVLDLSQSSRGEFLDNIGKLYDHYVRRIFNYIYYRVLDSTLAEDLTSEIFTKALENADKFDPKKGTVENWLVTIARNTLISHFRKKRLRKWANIESVEHSIKAHGSLEDTVVQRENFKSLEVALVGLRERERDLIGLKFGFGLSNRQIARATGLSESYVGVILFRVLKQLRKELGFLRQ